ncbi:YxiF family protein [Fictibacillus barbaricus]|uniref:Uncharacterized protein n=1 Tax=Fictibacillus barbaricus TaxID=182136 RepID=A0ABS2Z919_9BACL|nr:hypothetical protein [Fictibacillus barbaricus]MBN3543748.1 hypothetical protein [Fictibacillus barbaricus]GGB72791.1 hypothetical protein GCM10007199_43720 [Fictibacillus barbaricus]
MEVNDRKKRIRSLQIKKRREKIIKEMKAKNISLSLDSFLDIQYSMNLLNELFDKIDKLKEDKHEIKFKHSNEVAIKHLSDLKLKMPFKFQYKKVILFHQNHLETGAIIINIEDVFKEINWMVSFSGYTKETFDFIIVEPKLEYGICIEIREYQDILTNWGLFN